jgi:hypothetical protein
MIKLNIKFGRRSIYLRELWSRFDHAPTAVDHQDLESSDAISPIPSTAEIPDVGYIPHVPHRQRTVY